MIIYQSRSAIIFSLFVILAVVPWQLLSQDQISRPNILFILSDDHTAQAWGIYGGILAPYVKNDNIRRLAASGAVLDNAFCTNSICTPSRASILTGQYSHRNGVYELDDALDPDTISVAKLLQQGGYQTALFGKWHLKKKPAGFDDFLVLPGQGRYHNPLLKGPGNWQDANAGGVEYRGYVDDVITDQAIKWLEQHENDKPFFLCTQFKATHEPFDYPERYRHFLENVELPYPDNLMEWGAAATGRTHDGWPLEILGQRFVQHAGTTYPGPAFSLTGLDSVEARKKIYQKFVHDFLRAGAAIDDNIGRLIDYLQGAGLWENTVVIYTADQGYFLGEHAYFDKRFIYEQSLRMPFVISYPPEIPPGSHVKDMILNIDFAPLFLDFAGLAIPAAMQGRSFRNNLQGRTPVDWRQAIYYHYWTNQPERPAHYGIRTERYKLAYFYGKARPGKKQDSMPYPPGWEFYDLKKDPDESNNLYIKKSNSRIVRKLKGRLESLKQSMGDWP
ncbi:MAG: sulfatase [Saprospiraceae bacterium]|nr:sulfatase [Saprospiraceae bacterium]